MRRLGATQWTTANAVLGGYLLLGLMLASGCGEQPLSTDTPPQTDPTAAASEESASGTLTGTETTTTASVDDANLPLPEPATAEQAARILDLRTFPAMEGAEFPGGRCLASLYCKVKADAKTAFQFHRGKLLEQGWKELPDSRVDDQSANGVFARDAYLLSVSVFPSGGSDAAGEVNVSVTNHGNINPRKLPVPGDAKPFYGTPTHAMYLTEKSARETSEWLRKQFLQEGWSPYGGAVGGMNFKRNAIEAMVNVSLAPAQGGKTVINISTNQLSVDLPAPAEATNLQFTDSLKQLFFDAPGQIEDVVAYYQEQLAPRGWKSTTEKANKIDWKHFLILRNPQKDMIEIEMYPFEGRTRVIARHKTAAEVAELDRQFKEEAARRERERNKPDPKVAVPIPQGAKDLDEDSSTIEFLAPQGSGKELMDMYRQYFKKLGWKEELFSLDDSGLGNLVVENDQSHSIDIDFFDDSFEKKFEVTIDGFGVDLESVEMQSTQP